MNELRYHIEQDSDPLNPRLHNDNFSIMVFKHRNYQLGEELPKHIQNRFPFRELYRAMFREYGPMAYVTPVFMYDHSGITISTTPFGCHWDSGLLGWCFVPISKVIEAFGEKWPDKKIYREKGRNIAETKIKDYDTYLRGEIYGYVIYDVENPSETIESCGGYYDYDQACKDAEACIKHLELMIEDREIEAMALLLDNAV